MHNPLRFGLIGCGNFGVNLGRYIREVAEVVAVCDIEEAQARRTAKALGLDVPVHTDYRKLIGEVDLDAVAITAANFVHCEIACAAAAAGLHVFCEKAMAVNLSECRQMAEAAREHDIRMIVGHKRRLRPSWSRMIELTDDALLGEPVAITVTQYGDLRPYEYPGTWWADPARSGGPYAIFGVHVIDWFRAMCGEPVSVTAEYGEQIEKGYEFPDILHATYRFERGALATINTSFMYPLHLFREAQGPMVQCRHGGLKLVPQMQKLDLYWQRLDEASPHHETFPIEDDFHPAYRREVGDFVRWISEGVEPCLTWNDGLRCVEMMEGAYRSAQTGGAVVRFPLA